MKDVKAVFKLTCNGKSAEKTVVYPYARKDFSAEYVRAFADTTLKMFVINGASSSLQSAIKSGAAVLELVSAELI